jgi:chromosome partitioning protein
MTWIIAVTGLKGGVGKTTLSITLATTLHAKGQRVTIVDADPQGTAMTWAARAADLGVEGPPVVAMAGKQLVRDLGAIARGADLIVIDSPPRLGAEALAVMMAADLVLLPTAPGAADVWALQETINVLDQARSMKDIKAAIVMNRTDRTSLSMQARNAVMKLPLPVIEPGLSSRVAFGEAMLRGSGVEQLWPSSDAALQARNFTKAVLAALGDLCQKTSADSPSHQNALS